MLVKLMEVSAASEQAMLTRKLQEACRKYYNGESSEMSDLEFDRLSEQLADLERKNGFAYEGSPNLFVGSESVAELKKVRHEQPALSLDKVKYKDRATLAEWLHGMDGILSWKCDGLTNVLTYEDGRLIRSATRGNGEVGSDNTHNAVYFSGLPNKIPYTGKVIVRGEAMMTYQDFDTVNAAAGGIFENPRNLAAATVQMLDPAESRKRPIVFQAFKLVEPKVSQQVITLPTGASFSMDSEKERFAFMEALGFSVVEHELVSVDTILDAIGRFQVKIKDNAIPTDGLVLSYNNQVYAEGLGSTNKYPRGSIAMKWTDETVSTTVRSIHWSVGKTGQITPVAVFDPVRIGLGSNVSRASVHNLSILSHLSETGQTGRKIPLMIGSKVEVYLANMIIPQIASATSGIEPIVIPDHCPVCKEPTQIENNNGIEVLYCKNPNCPARTRGLLEHMFSKDAFDVKGLGSSQIEDLQEAEILTKYPAELFQMQKKFGERLPDVLRDMEGWGEKSWSNLVNAVEHSRRTSLRRFLYSLGIPMLGHDLSKKLSYYWKNDIQNFLAFYENPDAKELQCLDGVGETKATYLVNWCHAVRSSRKEHAMFQALIHELVFEAPQDTNASDTSLEGMTFVITGAVHHFHNRDELKAYIEAKGGKVAGSVSKKTTCLINNDTESTSGKNKKAKELGILILSENAFLDKFLNKPELFTTLPRMWLKAT